MKKNLKIDSFLLLSLLLLIINALVLINPTHTINYPYTFDKLEQKNQDIDIKQADYDSKAQLLRQKAETLKSKREYARSLEPMINAYQQAIYNTKWDLDIPSLIILLEQTAKDKKVDMTIYYDLIRTADNQPVFEDPAGINPEAIPGNSQSDGTTSPDVQTATEPSDNANEQSSDTALSGQHAESAGIENIDGNKNTTGGTGQDIKTTVKEIMEDLTPPLINGIKVTEIPIRLEGSYNEIKNYLSVMEDKDYIMPGFVDMASDGEKVEAIAVLYVFSK